MSGSEHEVFDTKFALGQFSGNQDLLIQILEKFISQYREVGPLLESYIQQGDTQAAKQQVHTIKGVSGNLGMRALHLTSKEFESTLLADVPSADIKQYLDILENTLIVAEQYASANTGVDGSNLVKTETEQTGKERLMNALKRNEFISERKLQDYLGSLDLEDSLLADLRKAIDDLDYSHALSLLQ